MLLQKQRSSRALSCGIALLFASARLIAANIDAIEHIDVIAVTPVDDIGVAIDKIPANVQTATAEQLGRQQNLDLSDFLNRNFGSVTVNAAQNNPLQPDVQYRGFTASPLLGLPQGLAVYVDGARANESFGDTVNWDLLPESIIDRVELMGGSNPLFGLNTLGGALSIATKNGFTAPGFAARASAGSFGRTVIGAEAGGNDRSFGYYLNAQHLSEDGWRDDSPSDATNLFGSIGWRTPTTSLDLEYFFADTDLTGNGPSPVQLLDVDREAVFTTPDTTKNRFDMVIATGSQRLRDDVRLSGNAFWRRNRVHSLNGDVSPFISCDDGADGGGLVNEADFVDTNANDACDAGEFDPAVLLIDQHGDVISNAFDAVDNRGRRDQDAYGGTLQVTLQKTLFDRDEQLIVGAAFDKATIDYRAVTEVATLQSDRSTAGASLYAVAAASAIDTHTRNASIYFMNLYAISPQWTLTLSGRYNDSTIDLHNAGAVIDANDDGLDDLDGNHGFARFNPAIGMTYQWTPQLNAYVGYSESSRTPTPVELACASETAPCTLPNTFVADPPLNEVVAKTYEVGLRGSFGTASAWSIGVFDTTNSNDILFQATGGSTGNQGFFANVGDTRRSGVEVGVSGTWASLSWFANYSFIRAVFVDSFAASSPAHPEAADLNGDGEAREIPVRDGDRIPGIPENNAKLGGDYLLSATLSIGGDVTFNSGQYLRGDEANLLNQTRAFAVVNVRAEYRFSEHALAFVTVQNLLDTDCETFGLLADPTDVEQFATYTDHRFFGPAPPRGAWVGIRASM